MYEMNSFMEWGGVLVEFSDDSGNVSSFSISKEDKVIKITGPNRKGAFEWEKIKSLKFEKVGEGQGLLSVQFVDEMPGTDDGVIVLGKISSLVWARIKQNTMDEIVLVSE